MWLHTTKGLFVAHPLMVEMKTQHSHDKRGKWSRNQKNQFVSSKNKKTWQLAKTKWDIPQNSRQALAKSMLLSSRIPVPALLFGACVWGPQEGKDSFSSFYFRMNQHQTEGCNLWNWHALLKKSCNECLYWNISKALHDSGANLLILYL